MATVIAFPKKQHTPSTTAPKAGTATIVMFTGVRIERVEDEPAQQRTPARRFFASSAQATAEDLED